MKIFYGFDTMCMFCYGFSPIIRRAYDQFKDQVDFVLLPGLMWRKGHDKLVSPAVCQKLTQATKRVTMMTQQVFSPTFYDLLSTEPVLNSFLSGKAMYLVFQEDQINPLDFLEGLYRKLFQEGQDTSKMEVVLEVVKEVGLNEEVFGQAMADLKDSQVEESLELLRAKGIDSYPSLVIEKHNILYTYPLNYSSYQALEEWIVDHMD